MSAGSLRQDPRYAPLSAAATEGTCSETVAQARDVLADLAEEHGEHETAGGLRWLAEHARRTGQASLRAWLNGEREWPD